MSNVFFTSDLHLGHSFVASLRGFDDVEEYNEYVVETWNKHVSKRDIVWNLGDVSLTAVKNIGPWLKRLNGTVHLVAGNHDKCHPIFRNAWKMHPAYLEYFATIQTSARVRLPSLHPGERGLSVLLSHFPYTGEGEREGEDRHVQWRLRDLGEPLIHGHTHDNKQDFSPSSDMTPMFHVGWDRWNSPVSAEFVANIFDFYYGIKEIYT